MTAFLSISRSRPAAALILFVCFVRFFDLIGNIAGLVGLNDKIAGVSGTKFGMMRAGAADMN